MAGGRQSDGTYKPYRYKVEATVNGKLKKITVSIPKAYAGMPREDAIRQVVQNKYGWRSQITIHKADEI